MGFLLKNAVLVEYERCRSRCLRMYVFKTIARCCLNHLCITVVAFMRRADLKRFLGAKFFFFFSV